MPPDFEAQLEQVAARNDSIDKANQRLKDLQSRCRLEREEVITDFSQYDEQCILTLRNIQDPADELAELAKAE